MISEPQTLAIGNLDDKMSDIDRIITRALRRAKAKIMNRRNRQRLSEPQPQFNSAGHQGIEADILSEDIIFNELLTRGLNGILFTEESGIRPFGNPEKENAIMLLLDPLDGSANFKKGIPFGCISVAYGKLKRNPVLSDLSHAQVLNLYDAELVFGIKNVGAWVNCVGVNEEVLSRLEGRPKINVYAYRKEYKQFFEDFDGDFSKKSLGSVAWELIMVSNNILQGLIDIRHKVKPYDFAAGMILVKATGGYFDFIGDVKPEIIKIDDFTTGYNIVATRDEDVHDRLVDNLTEMANKLLD